MMKAKTKPHPSVSLDTASIESLQYASVVGIYEDLSPVIAFVKKDGLTKSFGNMLYFSAANDLGQLTKTTQQLSQVLDVINHVLGDKSPSANLPIKLALLEEGALVNEAYTMVIRNLKLAYKIYGMRKPAVVVSMTKILQCLVEYNNSPLLSQFTDSFDFDHSAVHNILVPTRDDFEKKIIDDKAMRWAFVDFWISLCSASNPILRKTLLTNFKMMNNFWKYMEMEKFETLNKIFHFLDRYVCCEPTFKRATKCRILNENFLYNLRTLFTFVKSENDRHNDSEDQFEFSDFKLTFVRFMNVLVSDTERGITYPENEFGSPLVVNNISFSINNKLIFTLLTSLKPWDSLTQLQFVMQTLNHNTELLLPYMNWIVSNSGGYHEPTVSSYWIGHTLLYSEILKSSHFPVKAEFVSLAPLSKNALSQCIAFPSDLVKQLGLQLILLQLKKLLKAKTADQSLKDYVLSNMPSQTSFLPLLVHTNDLLKLTATLIVAAQEELAPKFSCSATVGLVSQELSVLNLSPEKCSSLDLILLDLYLSIQSSNELKWWSRIPGKNSFFTSLLKFSNLPFLQNKILKILQKLTKPTLVFNDDRLIESPLLVLIETTAHFYNVVNFEKMWACLDETIGRAVNSPYKYLDKSNKDYKNISIFLVVLFEQINFAIGNKSDQNISEWVNHLVTGMMIIGESPEGIFKAASEYNMKVSLTNFSSKPLSNIDSKFEFAQAVLTLRNMTQENLETSEVFDLMTNMGNFLASIDSSETSFLTFVISSSKWGFLECLGEERITENETLAICLYHELIRNLGINFKDSEIQNFVFKLARRKLSRKNQLLLRKFIWILDVDQMKIIAGNQINELIVLQVYHYLLEKGITVNADISFLMSIRSPEAHKILTRLSLSADQIKIIIENREFYNLLENPSPIAAECLLEADNLSDSLLYQISAKYPEIANKYRKRVVSLAISMRDWKNSLKIFAAYGSFFDQNQISKLVFERKECLTKEAMSSEFVGFVASCIKTLMPVPSPVINWFHRAMLYVTKRFAESTTLSSTFESFLHAFQALISGQNCFSKLVSSKILEAQLQVLLTSAIWSSQTKVLTYINHVLLSIEPGLVDSAKLLQLFISNDKNPLLNLPDTKNCKSRFHASLVIHSLFSLNETASATMNFLENVLSLYLGSQRADDLLLKDVLQKAEKRLTQSWVSRVTNWDYQNEISQEELEVVGEERLFIKDVSSFVVALNKKFVKQTTEAGFSFKQIPKKNFEEFEDFYHQCPSGTYQETTYDPEFLLLLLLNNEELAKETAEGIRFNLNKLVDSGLLRFVITSLSFDKVREIAKIILMGILSTLCDENYSFKDKAIMKVFISSIMHTLRNYDHSLPLVWSMLGSLCAIISNPGHFLYEQVHRYILSTPVFKESAIPLLSSITSYTKTDDMVDDDDYYKSINWIISQLAEGIKYPEDLKLLKSRDVPEWIFNLYNSRYASTRLQLNILRFLYALQRVGIEGTDMLTTKFAGLSTLEVMKVSASADRISALQERLNLDQLGLRIGAHRRQKRIAEWTFGNVESSVKRIHLA